MPHEYRADRIDALILQALTREPRATTIALAQRTGLSRNTVQARLARLEAHGALGTFERRIDPAILDYPLTAFIMTNVTQRKLTDVAQSLEEVPEVLEVHGLSGVADLLIKVVGRDADDLYRVAGRILDIKGVKRTSTALVMRDLVDYRLSPLVAQVAQ